MNARARIAVLESQPLPVPVAVPSRPEPPPSSVRGKRRALAWLALHLKQWPLYAALSELPQAQRLQMEAQPLAVLGDDRRRRVLTCNDAAWRRGIRPGHALNAAMALCAEVKLLPRASSQELRLLEAAAQWLQHYTPCVSLEPPDELLLEVRGSFKLFGGANNLIERVLRDLNERGIAACAALSVTARSALWLSRTQQICVVPPRQLKARLADMPIECLQWPDDIELRLRRFGVTTLAQLLRLPRADLARRIGGPCARELNCGLGRQIEIRRQFNPPEPYLDRIVLDYEIETTGLLETLLVRRLEKLQGYLREGNLALGCFAVELVHRERAPTSLRIGFVKPTGAMEYAVKLLREKLLQLVLPAPVIEVRLRAERLLMAQERSAGLFDATAAASYTDRQEKLTRLLEQLRVRLGERAILTLKAHQDHRPEKAQRSEGAAIDFSPALPLPAVLPQRPLWLLSEPRVLDLRASGMQVLRGPERIEAGWWDGGAAARDYYIAKTKSGALCWIFNQSRDWFLHGLFG